MKNKYFNDLTPKEILSETIVYDNGGETYDRYTIFTPDGSVFGMSEDAKGFNQFLGDHSEIEEGDHLGKKLKGVPKAIQNAVLERMEDEEDSYGDGGSIAKGNYQMILSQAKEVKHHATELQNILKNEKDIDAWVVAKMENVSSTLSDITHYLDGKTEYGDGGEVDDDDLIEDDDNEYAKGGKVTKTTILNEIKKIDSEITQFDNELRKETNDSNPSDNRIDFLMLKISKLRNEKSRLESEIDNKKYHFTVTEYPNKLSILDDNSSYSDFYGTKKEVIDFSFQRMQRGYSSYFSASVNNGDWFFESQDFDNLKQNIESQENEYDDNEYDDNEYANGGQTTIPIQVVIDGDFDEPKFFKTFSLAKKFVLDNVDKYDMEILDSYGDSIYVEKNSTKRDLDFLFGDTKYSNGGSIEDMMKKYELNRMMVRSKVALAIGIDNAMRYLDQDFVVSPYSLLEGAVNKGFIDAQEIDKNLWESALSEAYSIDDMYRDSGQGIGGSDMNAFISSMLNDAGIKIEVVNNRYERVGRKFAKGGAVGSNYEIELFWKGLKDDRLVGKYIVSSKTLDNLEEEYAHALSIDVLDESSGKAISYYDLKKKIYAKGKERGFFAEGGETESTIDILMTEEPKVWDKFGFNSGSEIRASKDKTKKYAQELERVFTAKGIKKGSLTKKINEDLTDENYHLLNEFLTRNGYFNSKLTDELLKSYNNPVYSGAYADKESITIEAKAKPNPSGAKKIQRKKLSAKTTYISNREIEEIDLKSGKKIAGSDIVDGVYKKK